MHDHCSEHTLSAQKFTLRFVQTDEWLNVPELNGQKLGLIPLSSAQSVTKRADNPLNSYYKRAYNFNWNSIAIDLPYWVVLSVFFTLFYFILFENFRKSWTSSSLSPYSLLLCAHCPWVKGDEYEFRTTISRSTSPFLRSPTSKRPPSTLPWRRNSPSCLRVRIPFFLSFVSFFKWGIIVLSCTNCITEQQDAAHALLDKIKKAAEENPEGFKAAVRFLDLKPAFFSLLEAYFIKISQKNNVQVIKAFNNIPEEAKQKLMKFHAQ